MTNAELIKQLRGCKDIEFCSDCPRMPNGIIEPCNIKDEAADALEAAEKRIKELPLDCELFQQKCMELEAQMKTVTDCHALNEKGRCEQE